MVLRLEQWGAQEPPGEFARTLVVGPSLAFLISRQKVVLKMHLSSKFPGAAAAAAAGSLGDPQSQREVLSH